MLPIDFETYKQLKNNISKALVPHLQIWLYATAGERVFKKRYSELCEHLNIREYQYLSYIKQTLDPALDELVTHNYLAGWAIERPPMTATTKSSNGMGESSIGIYSLSPLREILVPPIAIIWSFSRNSTIFR